MTRIATSMLLLIVLQGCTAVDPRSGNTDTAALSWRILSEGGSSRLASGNPGPQPARLEIARTGEEYERLWARYIGEQERPPVAFDEESVLFLLGGVQSTGGYEVDADDISVEGDRLIVDASVKGPPPGSMVSQAFSAPWAVVAVNKRDFVEAQWVDQGRMVARKMPQDRTE